MEGRVSLSSTPNETEKPEQEAGSVDISLLDIYQLLELFVMLLSEQAWRYMGLQVDPRTKEINRDFIKAHVAIDSIIALVEKMEPYLSSAEKERLRNLITNLQINFAQQKK